MRKYFIISILCIMGFSLTYAQKDKDKGRFIPYENEFYYEQIRKTIAEEKEAEEKRPRVFKTDFSTVDVPESPDQFNTAWCTDPLSQGNTGTCWCFSTSSFYESEIFRLNKKKVKLSELYIVYWEYVEKAREFIRTRGKSYFGEGSETNAVARMMKKYGLVPKEAYKGKPEKQRFHNHAPMFEEMKAHLQYIKETNSWDEEQGLANIKAILNHYMGEPPSEFSYDGKKYTPEKFMNEYAGLNPDDYVDFMSLMEKEYWTQAEYDVPDNWWNSDVYYNVPLDDFMGIIKGAVKDGYTISIGGDVSSTGYSPEHDAAVVPSYDIPSEYIDESARQLRFSNKSTTDDHAIHMIGYKEGEDGWWFLIKDSGSGARNGKHEGYYFYHEDYVKLKIMTFTIHKDAAKAVLKKFK